MKKLIAILIFAGIVAAALIHDMQAKTERYIKTPDIEDVAQAEIILGGPPGLNREPIEMDLTDNMQKITVAEILYWLSHAEYAGTPRNQYMTHGGGPNEFVLKSKQGETTVLTDAFDTVSAKVSNGLMMTGVSVRDQVNIEFSNKKKAIRIIAPDFKKWMESDMNKIIEDRLKERQLQKG